MINSQIYQVSGEEAHITDTMALERGLNMGGIQTMGPPLSFLRDEDAETETPRDDEAQMQSFVRYRRGSPWMSV